MYSDGDRTGNCHAGFVADKGLSSPIAVDFYLQSHAAIQGSEHVSALTLLCGFFTEYCSQPPKSLHCTSGRKFPEQPRRVSSFLTLTFGFVLLLYYDSDYKSLRSRFATSTRKPLAQSLSRLLFIVSLTSSPESVRAHKFHRCGCKFFRFLVVCFVSIPCLSWFVLGQISTSMMP